MDAKSNIATNAGHRARLRRKFLDVGLGALHDHEALELLLTYAIPRRDVKGLAKQLIARFGSFEAVFDATEYELSAIPGVGENAAALILLAKAINARYLERRLVHQPQVLDAAAAVIQFARTKIGGNAKETMLVLYLDKRKQLLEYQCIPGTVDHAIVYHREILEKCLQNKATAVILAHNHPSGICQPSSEDIALTLKVRNALAAVDIELVDHLIVSPTAFASLRSNPKIL